MRSKAQHGCGTCSLSGIIELQVSDVSVWKRSECATSTSTVRQVYANGSAQALSRTLLSVDGGLLSFGSLPSIVIPGHFGTDTPAGQWHVLISALFGQLVYIHTTCKLLRTRSGSGYAQVVWAWHVKREVSKLY